MYVLRFALRTKLNPFRAMPIDWNRFREKKEEKEAKHFFAFSTFLIVKYNCLYITHPKVNIKKNLFIRPFDYVHVLSK